MKLSVILEAMIASGASAESLVAVVKAHEDEQQRLKDEKRAKDAARKRNQRARSQNVTPCPRDITDIAGQAVTAADSADAEKPSPPLSPPSLSPTPPISPPPISPPVISALARKPADEVRETLETVLTPGTAKDVIAHRKALRKPLTVRAAKGLVKAYARCRDGPEAAAEAQITNGWQGFKPEWMENDDNRNSAKRRSDANAGSRYASFLGRAEAAGDVGELRWDEDRTQDGGEAGREPASHLRLAN